VTEATNAGIPVSGNSGEASSGGLKGKLTTLKSTSVGASFVNGLS
jgi:hypothetical protein